MKALSEMSNLVQDEGIFYVASGRLTQNILQSIVSTTRDGIYDSYTNKKYSPTDIDSLITITIEVIQNISKYRQEIDNYHHDLVLIRVKDSIVISASNLTNEEHKNKLIKSIDFLNSLDESQLREYSKENLRQITDKDKNSSGSGLINIAMLSKTNIEYNIEKYKEYDDIFKFDITINL
jgi:hypothetical protein